MLISLRFCTLEVSFFVILFVKTSFAILDKNSIILDRDSVLPDCARHLNLLTYEGSMGDADQMMHFLVSGVQLCAWLSWLITIFREM